MFRHEKEVFKFNGDGATDIDEVHMKELDRGL